MRGLINKIVNKISQENNYTQEQKEQVEYTLRVLTFEIIKMILLLIIFSLSGYFKEALIILLAMSFTKPFIGGYHEETQSKCFLATFLLTSAIIFLSFNSRLEFITTVILGVINIFAVYHQAPIINPMMPLSREDLIRRNRILGLVSVVFLVVLSICTFNINNISLILIWTITIQTILMFNKK
ncbi:hypothetical protein JCM1393_08790 [Clostridium carnis]